MPRLDHIGRDAADECDAHADMLAETDELIEAWEMAQAARANAHLLRLHTAVATRHADAMLIAALDERMSDADRWPLAQILEAFRGRPEPLRDWVDQALMDAAEAHGDALTLQQYRTELRIGVEP